jgi:hypothetical protein
MKLYNNLILKFSKKARVIKASDSSEEDNRPLVQEKKKVIRIKQNKFGVLTKSKINTSNTSANKSNGQLEPVYVAKPPEMELFNPKPIIKSSRMKRKPKSKSRIHSTSSRSINRSKSKKIEKEVKVNLNINIQEINNTQTNIYYFNNNTDNTVLLNMQDSPSSPRKQHTDMTSNYSGSKSPSKWKKLSNIISTVNCLRRYDTKNIDGESDIDQDLNDYKTRLHNNTIKSRFIESQPEILKDLSYVSKKDYEDELRRGILTDILE